MSVLTRADVLSCLRTVCVRMAHDMVLAIRTERRALIPKKITVEGENACQISADLG